MSDKIKAYIREELVKTKRAIVATPESRQKLDSFARTNNGTNDMLLTQLSVNYGYSIAMANVLEMILKMEGKIEDTDKK